MAFTTTTGAGGTSLIGTSGVDTLSLTSNSTPLYVGAQDANDVINIANTSTTTTVEGGKGADTIILSTSTSNTVNGGYGNDTLTVGSTMTGGLLQGLYGADSITLAAVKSSALINGNAGNDVITVGGAVTASSILGGADVDTITFSDVAVTEGSKINGNKGNDVAYLGAVDNNMSSSTIFGGEGNDTLDGGNDAAGSANHAAGKLILSGDKGNDTVIGGNAADTLYGGEGNDSISAQATGTLAAADSLIGGAGSDRFVNTGANITTTDVVADTKIGDTDTVSATDIITDFDVAADAVKLNAALTAGGVINGTATALADGAYYFVAGTLGSDGVFTVKSINNGGFDTLIAAGSGTADVFEATETSVVLKGVLATSLTGTNVYV